jgi:hypothetical protein
MMISNIYNFVSRFAYVEFMDKESVENALKLDDTPFKGRQLKVINSIYIFSILPQQVNLMILGASETSKCSSVSAERGPGPRSRWGSI